MPFQTERMGTVRLMAHIADTECLPFRQSGFVPESDKVIPVMAVGQCLFFRPRESFVEFAVV